jgi:hypothetical protein
LNFVGLEFWCGKLLVFILAGMLAEVLIENGEWIIGRENG